MDEVRHLITMLRRQVNITDLEFDIVCTWDELEREPFETGSAYGQFLYNKTLYADTIADVGGEESDALHAIERPITDEKVRHALSLQLSHMLEFERRFLRYPRPLTVPVE